MVKVIKRDCTEVDFQKEKISNAILKAMKNGSGIVRPKIAEDIANEIYEKHKDEKTKKIEWQKDGVRRKEKKENRKTYK